jgi:hypothetical protein
MNRTRAITEPVNVIYPPPRDELPFLVVTLAGKELEVIPTRTETEARLRAVRLTWERAAKPNLKAEALN